MPLSISGFHILATNGYLAGDDYPHENIEAIRQLESYPHHFQRRAEDSPWLFESSPMRGNIEQEIDLVIATVKIYLDQ